MPIFMDVHNIEGGVAAADVAQAHQADLAIQAQHGVTYVRYWVDEQAGKIFCPVSDRFVEVHFRGACSQWPAIAAVEAMPRLRSALMAPRIVWVVLAERSGPGRPTVRGVNPTRDSRRCAWGQWSSYIG
jgi:hypothetical protein